MQSTWARWFWKDRGALGRWHAIADRGVATNGKAVVVLACGRVRRPPTDTAPRPSDECCPKCRAFDDLRLGYKPDSVEAPTLVTAGAN